MITFFSTAKNFTGKTRVAQLNAIRSWQHSVENAQIIIFGKSEGIKELAGQPGIFIYPEIKTSPEGTPHIDDMFIKAQQLAEHNICCFINADIIATGAFSETIIKIHQKLKGRYLLVGQRYDINLDQLLNFNRNWELKFHQLNSQKMTVHPPLGSDYFAFPRGQYKSMPNLLVGRGGWDLWMIFDGRVRNFKVVDLSQTVMVYHQDHDYKHRSIDFTDYTQDNEALINLQHLPAGETYDYTLSACNYSFKAGLLQKNFARDDLRQFIRFERNILRHRLIKIFHCPYMIEFFTANRSIAKQKKELKQRLISARPINLIIGSGGMKREGWLSTDKDTLDITFPLSWEEYFHPGSIDRILAEHVFEHLTEPECRTAMKACNRFLKTDGLLRIAVPDGYRNDPEYSAEVTPPKDGHQLLFSVDTLIPLLESCGFQATPLEYFDVDGNFHSVSWDIKDGCIMRSLRFDKQARFKRGDIYYTSLIVDARKI